MSATDQNPAVPSAPCVVPPDHTQWFKQEVHLHDGQLKSWLKGNFPAVKNDVEDIAQESYLRIWKAKASRPIDSAKSFLFSIARHLAIDRLRRNRSTQFVSVGDIASVPVLDDRPSALDTLTERELLSLLSDAIVALPERTRNIIILHKFKGASQAETARQLGLTEKAVERQVARGVELVTKFFRSKGHEFL